MSRMCLPEEKSWTNFWYRKPLTMTDLWKANIHHISGKVRVKCSFPGVLQNLSQRREGVFSRVTQNTSVQTKHVFCRGILYFIKSFQPAERILLSLPKKKKKKTSFQSGCIVFFFSFIVFHHHSYYSLSLCYIRHWTWVLYTFFSFHPYTHYVRWVLWL